MEYIELILNHIESVWYIYVLGTVFIGAVSYAHASIKKICKIIKLVEVLSTQFEPNSGSSIRDALDRIEDKINFLNFIKFAHLDILAVPVFLTDGHGKYTWANKAYMKLLGVSFDSLIGTAWEMTIHDEDRQEVVTEWYRACLESRPFNMEYRVLSVDKYIIIKCEAYGKNNIGYFGYIKEVKKDVRGKPNHEVSATE